MLKKFVVVIIFALRQKTKQQRRMENARNKIWEPPIKMAY